MKEQRTRQGIYFLLFCSLFAMGALPIPDVLAQSNQTVLAESAEKLGQSTPTASTGDSSVSSTGISQECDTFCGSAEGAGDTLCQTVMQLATVNNKGQTGLSVNNAYRANGAVVTEVDPVAARLAAEQAAQAKTMGRVVDAFQRNMTSRLRPAE